MRLEKSCRNSARAVLLTLPVLDKKLRLDGPCAEAQTCLEAPLKSVRPVETSFTHEAEILGEHDKI